MFRRFATLVLVLKWPVGLGLVLLTLLTGGAMFRLQIDPSMETLFVKNSPEYVYYNEYRQKYGSDQMIAVAVSMTDIFTRANLRILKKLTEEIASFPNVERVLSLANAIDIRHKMFGIKIEPVMKGLLEGKKSLRKFKKNVLSNELYLNNLVSQDGKVANLLIYLKPSKKNVHRSGLSIEKLRKHLAARQRPGLAFYVAGSPVEQYDFVKLIRRDQFTFVPMITLLLIATTFLIYRNLACMIVSMATVFISLIWILGTIALLGQPLNLMTSLLAPVIMINAVVNSIHLINLFFEIRYHHASLRKAAVLTMEQLGVPCFLTQFTTVLGFFSLALNPVPAIQSFGIFAALGTFYSYIIELILTPLLFPILPYRRLSDSLPEKHWLRRIIIGFIEKLDFKWKWWIVVLTAASAVLSVQGTSLLQVDNNLVRQLKPSLPLAVATHFIDENLTGVYSLAFVLRRKDGGTFADYETLRQVDRFKNYMEAKPEITKVNSITTLIKKINQAKENDRDQYLIPEDRELLERYFRGILETKDPEIFKLISPDLKEIRLEARMKAVGTTQGAVVENTARRFLSEDLGKYFEYHLTGNVVLLGKMAKGLVDNQIQSFGFAFASILISIIVLFRSIKLGLLAAIPNLIPILWVYGAMGFMGIELSSTTAMISSIVLGMVVDASIHFLHRFREEFSRRFHYLQSLHHTYRNVGQALVVSTLILVVGFASSFFASFRPTVHFGILTSLIIFLALICTLVILPVCLLIVKPFGPQRLFKRRWDSSTSLESIQAGES